MLSTIYKRKAPLLVFLLPAFLFLAVYLYYPFIQNIINTFLIRHKMNYRVCSIRL